MVAAKTPPLALNVRRGIGKALIVTLSLASHSLRRCGIGCQPAETSAGDEKSIAKMTRIKTLLRFRRGGLNKRTGRSVLRPDRSTPRRTYRDDAIPVPHYGEPRSNGAKGWICGAKDT